MRGNKTKRANSLLGLDLADGQLRAFHVARTKGGLEVVKSAATALTLDLQHPEPELIGQEIANHLAAAGINERHCLVALPPGWIMGQHTCRRKDHGHWWCWRLCCPTPWCRCQSCR